MTDKQIIIDDVEVYKCANAKRSIFGIDVECRLGGDCSQNPNCYYKQLKRKEQECEELREEIVNRNEKIEELRFSVSDLTNRLCGLNAEKSFRIVDLIQTLTEIKELAESVTKDGAKCEICETDGYCVDCEDEILRQILQKCEVIKDEVQAEVL